MKNNTKKIVIGVVGSDCHAAGNKLIHSMLEDAGFQVINVGVLSPQIDFIYAALESNADAIIMSSIHGRGEHNFVGTREKCNELGLKDILLYAGGNLTSKIETWSITEEQFKAMGFNRVYSPGTSFEITLEDLKKDLNIK